MTCRIGPEPCRNCLDFELSDTDGEVETDDDLEGMWPLYTYPTVAEIECDCRRGWRFRGIPMTSLKSATLY